MIGATEFYLGAGSLLLALCVLIFKMGRFTGEVSGRLGDLQTSVNKHQIDVAARFSQLDQEVAEIHETKTKAAEAAVMLQALREEVALVRKRTHDLNNTLIAIQAHIHLKFNPNQESTS